MGAETIFLTPGVRQRCTRFTRRPDVGFLRGLAVTSAGNAMSRALGLAFALAVAGLFVPADYGYIRWAISVAMLAGIPAAAGPIALARALGAARDDPARQRGLAGWGLAVIGAVTAASAVATALVLAALGRPVGGVLAVLVGMTIFAACYNVYRGVGSAWRIAALYAGGNGLQLAVVLLVCGALGLTVPDLVLLAYGFAWVGVLLVIELRPGPHPALGAPPLPFLLRGGEGAGRATLGVLWQVWGPLVLAQTAYLAWTWADVVLVEHFLGAAAAGQYGLARTIVTLFLLVPEAVAMLLLPHVASQGRKAEALTGSLLALTAVVSVMLLGVVLVLAPPALEVLADGRYAPASAALPGLAAGMALYALYMVLEGHLVGIGRASAHAIGATIMAVVTLGGAALLLPILGLAGAGLAFALGAAAGLATLGIVWLRLCVRRGDVMVRPHVAMVSYCHYLADPRVRRQAEALVAHGYDVNVICQRQPDEAAVEQVCGVTVRRVGRPKYRGASVLRYAFGYLDFFWHSFLAVTRLHQRYRLVAVQVYSMPEALMVAALWPKLRGVPVIYDAGDLTSEMYGSRFSRRGGPLLRIAVRLQERLGLGLADHVVTVHDDYRRRVIARGVPAERVSVVMNLPDERLFTPALREQAAARHRPDEFLVVYHGTLVARYGVDVAVEAVALLRERIPGLRLEIYGDGDLRPRLLELIAQHDLANHVYLSPGYLPLEAVAPLVAAASAAVVPPRSDIFTETSLPNKLLEYLALGLPTVVTRTAVVEAHVPADAVEYCRPGDAADMARALERLWRDPARREALAMGALRWSAAHRWTAAAAAYCADVDRLAAHGHGAITTSASAA